MRNQSDLFWLNRQKEYHPWMSENQLECWMFICWCFRGAHHIPSDPKEFGRGISVTVYLNTLATFDFDQLTRIVVAAHDAMVRVELGNGGPNRIKLIMHKRWRRDGAMHKRYPTIEQATSLHRYPATDKGV